MSTISNILEGKTGNYLKLEDLGDEALLIIESIDPNTTEIRSEKVKNKEGSKTPETEYFHILGRLGDVEKDLSLTFTALKQLAAVMPRDENWRGYSFKYTGTKGSGKNIKYGYQVIGKQEIAQARLPTDKITDPAGIVLSELNKFPKGMDDTPFWEVVCNNTKTTAESMMLVEKLKKEGKVTQDNEGVWRAIRPQ